MLARADHGDLDHGARRASTERLCIATREVKPIEELIRFVVDPDGTVVPDVKRKLPGRGVWVSANRPALATAIERKLFARSFRCDVRVPPDLADTVDRMLVKSSLDALSIARKAGLLAVGFGKTEAALLAGSVLALIHAAEAQPDGVRKLAAAARRAGLGEVSVVSLFTSDQLDLALGRPHVIHAALLAGPASRGFIARVRSLERFRSGDAGLRKGAAHCRKGAQN